MKVSKLAMDTAKEVIEYFRKAQQEGTGRAADHGVHLPFIAAMIEAAPDGNHVDIGTLFGASAITAALMKKKLGHSGKTYCIDPYNVDERSANVVFKDKSMPEELLSGSPEALMENAKYFDVELTLIQKYSHPWPEELDAVTFATGYIDGDHANDAPWNDFENLRGRVSHYIGCDNYEEEYPAVMAAMERAIGEDDWTLYYKNIGFIALRRPIASRNYTTDVPFSLLAL